MFGFKRRAALLDERLHGLIMEKSRNALAISTALSNWYDAAYSLDQIYSSIGRLSKKKLIRAIPFPEGSSGVHNVYEAVPPAEQDLEGSSP